MRDEGPADKNRRREGKQETLEVIAVGGGCGEKIEVFKTQKAFGIRRFAAEEKAQEVRFSKQDAMVFISAMLDHLDFDWTNVKLKIRKEIERVNKGSTAA